MNSPGLERLRLVASDQVRFSVKCTEQAKPFNSGLFTSVQTVNTQTNLILDYSI